MTERIEEYQIVVASLRDVHAIRHLEQVIFPLDAYTYLSLTSLLMWPGQSNFKAVTTTGDLVGFVAGAPNFATHIDWIVTLGVHPDHQRKGLGRRLLTACEDSMTQESIYLTVRASNEHAIHLYESAGYLYKYTEAHYYNDGENGIVMGKTRQNPDEPPKSDSLLRL